MQGPCEFRAGGTGQVDGHVRAAWELWRGKQHTRNAGRCFQGDQPLPCEIQHLVRESDRQRPGKVLRAQGGAGRM